MLRLLARRCDLLDCAGGFPVEDLAYIHLKLPGACHAQPTKTVFISYHRNVASFIARAIFLELRANGYDVFMDVESIDSSAVDTIILRQIKARAHFVLILTPGALEALHEPGDWLRREIEHARGACSAILCRCSSAASLLPGCDGYTAGKFARRLPRFNGLDYVPHDYFEEAMARLMSRFLKQPLYGVIAPTPTSNQASNSERE